MSYQLPSQFHICHYCSTVQPKSRASLTYWHGHWNCTWPVTTQSTLKGMSYQLPLQIQICHLWSPVQSKSRPSLMYWHGHRNCTWQVTTQSILKGTIYQLPFQIHIHCNCRPVQLKSLHHLLCQCPRHGPILQTGRLLVTLLHNENVYGNAITTICCHKISNVGQ